MKKRIIRRNDKIQKVIYSEDVRNLCRLEDEKYKKTFTRNRKISCADLLLMALNKQGKNTAFEIRNFTLRKKGEIEVMFTNEAYLKQRRNLNPNVFKELNKIYLEDFYEDKEYIKRTNEYIVFAIDGSKEEIPNTPKNRKEFGCAENKGGKNVARALTSGIYDINNEFYLDIQIDKYKANEIDLAKRNIEKMIEIIGVEKILVILDRGYPSIEFFHWLVKHNVKFLIRLPSKDYKVEKQRMQTEDEIIELKYTSSRLRSIKKKYPDTYNEIKEKTGAEYRFTKIELNEKTTEYLISNLPKEEFSTEELKELYGKRWKIETSYNTIKNKLKIESFTGNLPIFIYQDIYAQMFVYNQVQDMLCAANEELGEKNKDKNLKLEHKINENNAIGLYKEQYIKILLIEDKEKRASEYEKLMKDMELYTSAIRANRAAQPRKWNTSNKYRTNYKPSF